MTINTGPPGFDLKLNLENVWAERAVAFLCPASPDHRATYLVHGKDDKEVEVVICLTCDSLVRAKKFHSWNDAWNNLLFSLSELHLVFFEVLYVSGLRMQFWAEDILHAKEQAEDANPADVISHIYEF